jgi:predicted enzyme related to lactoylglutathione lyase
LLDGVAPVTLQVNVDVPDLERGIAFYRDAFGYRLARRLFGGSVAELAGAPCPFFLIEKGAGSVATARTTAASRRDYARHWTPVHLELVVPDVEQAVARAVAAGASVEAEVATGVWGKIAVLADPFGHGFCLIEFLGRGYDEIADPR